MQNWPRAAFCRAALHGQSDAKGAGGQTETEERRRII